jgi:hypothetical protein
MIRLKSRIFSVAQLSVSSKKQEYSWYCDILEEAHSDRLLYLAVTGETYESLFAKKYGQFGIKPQRLKLTDVQPQTDFAVARDHYARAL